MPTRVDAVIGVVLAFAVVASVIGVLTYEDDRGGLFRVEWEEARDAIAAGPSTRTGAGAIELTFDVTTTNLTRVDLNVSVTGAGPRLQPVELLVEVVPPNGTAPLQEEAQLGVGPAQTLVVPFTFTIAAMPAPEDVRAASPDAAAAATAAPSSTLGQGPWIVRVTFAPGSPGPLGNAESFTASVDGAAVGYRAVATPATPEVGR